MEIFGHLLAFVLIFLLYFSYSQLPPSPHRVIPDSGAFTPSPTSPNLGNFRLLQLIRAQSSSAVLFIPGHRGEPGQSLPLSLQLPTVDVYAVDFNKAPTAFSTAVLMLETKFVEECLEMMMRKYRGKVVVVGHSMGGVVAALAISHLPHPNLKLLLCLSSPLHLHPLNIDLQNISIYAQIHTFWKYSSIPFLSISGGIRDLMVPAALTTIEELPNKRLFTSQLMENNEFAIDHLAILWSETVLKIVKNAINSYLFSETQYKITKSNEISLGNLDFDCCLDLMPSETPQNFDITRENTPKGLFLYTGNAVEVVVIGGNVEVLRERNSKMVDLCSGRSVWVGEKEVTVLKLMSMDLIRAYNEVIIQKVEEIHENPGFLTIFFGHKTYKTNSRALKMDLGSSFSSHYPLKLHFSSAAHLTAHCGSQDFFSLGTDTILWFQGDCTDPGLQLFLLPVSASELTVTVTIDLLGSILLHFVDFRLMLGTWTVAAVMLDGKEGWSGAAVGVVWMCGAVLRRIGMGMVDHVHAQGLNLGVVDVLFLCVTARFLAWLFTTSLHFFRFSGKFTSLPLYPTCRRLILLSCFLSLFCPCISLLPLLLTSFYPTISRRLLSLCWIHWFFDLPELISWCLFPLPATHNLPLSCSLVFLHFTLFALFTTNSDFPVTSTHITGLYILIFTYDLLYRAKFAILLCEIYLFFAIYFQPKVSLN